MMDSDPVCILTKAMSNEFRPASINPNIRVQQWNVVSSLYPRNNIQMPSRSGLLGTPAAQQGDDVLVLVAGGNVQRGFPLVVLCADWKPTLEEVLNGKHVCAPMALWLYGVQSLYHHLPWGISAQDNFGPPSIGAALGGMLIKLCRKASQLQIARQHEHKYIPNNFSTLSPNISSNTEHQQIAASRKCLALP